MTDSKIANKIYNTVMNKDMTKEEKINELNELISYIKTTADVVYKENAFSAFHEDRRQSREEKYDVEAEQIFFASSEKIWNEMSEDEKNLFIDNANYRCVYGEYRYDAKYGYNIARDMKGNMYRIENKEEQDFIITVKSLIHLTSEELVNLVNNLGHRTRDHHPWNKDNIEEIIILAKNYEKRRLIQEVRSLIEDDMDNENIAEYLNEDGNEVTEKDIDDIVKLFDL